MTSTALPATRRQPARRMPKSLARLAIAALALAATVTALGPIANPEPVNAGTAEYIEGLLVKWINSARAARGVPALRVGSKLTDLAGDRARSMATANKLGHPSCLSCVYRSRGISFRTCAEVVAMTSYPYGYEAAKSLYNSWKGSSGHWGILMSRSYTRFGVGVAYRSSNRTTYAASNLAG